MLPVICGHPWVSDGVRRVQSGDRLEDGVANRLPPAQDRQRCSQPARGASEVERCVHREGRIEQLAVAKVLACAEAIQGVDNFRVVYGYAISSLGCRR